MSLLIFTQPLHSWCVKITKPSIPNRFIGLRNQGHHLIFYTPKTKFFDNRESFFLFCHHKRIKISIYNFRDKVSFISQNRRIYRELFPNSEKQIKITQKILYKRIFINGKNVDNCKYQHLETRK